MGKKIYVGNLTYGTTDSAIRSLFESYGTVTSVNVITDRYSGESKGFAFVEMSTDEEAQNAISSTNGTDLDGRNIKVNEAMDRPQHSGNGGGGGNNRRRY